MLLNWCCSLNIFNVEKSVGGDVKKSITSSFFNRITFGLAVRCRTFQKICVESLKLKFQTVAEKTTKNFMGLLYFAAPGRSANSSSSWCSAIRRSTLVIYVQLIRDREPRWCNTLLDSK